VALAEHLRQVREAKGWSLRESAQHCRVSNGYISLLENGKIENPSASILAKLATGYGVSLDSLLAAAGVRAPTIREGALEPRLISAVKRLSPSDLNELTRYATYLAEGAGRRRRR